MRLKSIDKIVEVLRKRRNLKKIAFVLENGCYIFNGSEFSLEKNKKIIKRTKPHLKCSIFSKNKLDVFYASGSLKETKYKTIYIFENTVYYLYKDMTVYLSLKEKYGLYKKKLIYKTIDLNFDDNYKMVKSEKINGLLFEDEYHFNLFQNFYLEKIKEAPIVKKELNISGQKMSILFAPQHGDIHKRNLFWTSNTFCLIDLDDIDNYPLFYDLFYAYLSFKHESAFEYFHTDKFSNNVLKCYIFFDKTHHPKIDIVDLYLSQYVQFWINKINKDTDPFEPYFYLRWFFNANLNNFQLTKSALDSYFEMAKKFKKVFKK